MEIDLESTGSQGPFEIDDYDYLHAICPVGKLFATVSAGTERARHRVWEILLNK